MTQHQEDKEPIDSINSEESTHSTDPFDRLMFGNGNRNRSRSSSRSNKQEEVADSTEMLGDQVDFAQLMKQADDIMTSINKIKPVFKDLSPLLDYFRKK
ncbi:hypothetical protein [Fredinandcohnia sp. 179-A 10B2 NHS]|uniref:hypothetical protein n=1 Tax=Fredinandcohnia sp. 179-A 10B2 NHS TaxID=3235176 RepID=UPI0039A2CA1C